MNKPESPIFHVYKPETHEESPLTKVIRWVYCFFWTFPLLVYVKFFEIGIELLGMPVSSPLFSYFFYFGLLVLLGFVQKQGLSDSFSAILSVGLWLYAMVSLGRFDSFSFFNKNSKTLLALIEVYKEHCKDVWEWNAMKFNEKYQ